MRHFIRIVENAGLHFRTETRGYHHGQTDITLKAFVGDQLVGWIDYSVFENEVAVQMIQVTVKRQGYGTRLMHELQREYPDTQIDLGTLTADGAALVDSLPTHEIPNGDAPELHDRLEQVKQTLADYAAGYEALERSGSPEELRAYVEDRADWNDLNDEEYSLEQELHGRARTRRIFTAP